jgi:hypothetical protein
MNITVERDGPLAQATGLSAPATKRDSARPRVPYTIQTRVQFTILDVVVTDANGRPGHDLKPSDFTVFEDGQKMVSFRQRCVIDESGTISSWAEPRGYDAQMCGRY